MLQLVELFFFLHQRYSADYCDFAAHISPKILWVQQGVLPGSILPTIQCNALVASTLQINKQAIVIELT